MAGFKREDQISLSMIQLSLYARSMTGVTMSTAQSSAPSSWSHLEMGKKSQNKKVKNFIPLHLFVLDVLRHVKARSGLRGWQISGYGKIMIWSEKKHALLKLFCSNLIKLYFQKIPQIWLQCPLGGLIWNWPAYWLIKGPISLTSG